MAPARRITATTRIFQLKIQLAGIRPLVWRRVLVPGEMDLGELHDESRAKLFRLVERGSRLTYTYDFGDDWDHHITVEKVLDAQPGTRYPSCPAGRRACPPEDVGGPWGYSDFLQALNDPKHEDHEHYSDWIGGGFDPYAFDLAATDAALGAFAWTASPLRNVR